MKIKKRIVGLIQLILISFVFGGPAIASSDEVVRKVISPMPNRVLEYYQNGEKVATEWDDSANLPISIQGTIPDGTVKQYSGKNDVIEELEFKNGKLNGSAQ